jgi:hypothetical protein
LLDRAYLLVPAQSYVGGFLATFQEFPPRQKPASFSLDQVMEKLRRAPAHPMKPQITQIGADVHLPSLLRGKSDALAPPHLLRLLV